MLTISETIASRIIPSDIAMMCMAIVTVRTIAIFLIFDHMHVTIMNSFNIYVTIGEGNSLDS